MIKNIYDRIHSRGITMAIYTFILAWDNIIKENETIKQEAAIKKKEDDVKNNEDNNNAFNKPQAPSAKSENSILSNDFWKQENLTYDKMLSFATAFLKRKLKFDSNGKKLPHTIYDTPRKTMYPIQMDIVDYFWETKMVKIMYAEQSIQSKVSRELAKLAGIEKGKSIWKSDIDSAIVCVKRQYKPYAISDKRKAIADDLIKNINAVDEDNHLRFARLKKDIVYLLGNGAVVLFFEDKSLLDGTITFLEKYVSPSFLCDIFEIKGRLMLLLDGTEQEIADTTNDLAELVESVYSAQKSHTAPHISLQ